MDMGFRIWYLEWPYPENVFFKFFRIWDGYGFQDMVRGPSMVELSALSLVRKSDRSGSRYGILSGHILKIFLKHFSGYGMDMVFRIWYLEWPYLENVF